MKKLQIALLIAGLALTALNGFVQRKQAAEAGIFPPRVQRAEGGAGVFPPPDRRGIRP